MASPSRKYAGLYTHFETHPCMTGLVEQEHASGAHVLRFHAQLQKGALRVRAMIHQCRALFPRNLAMVDETATTVAAIEHASGWQTYTSSIYQQWRNDGNDIRFINNSIFKKCGHRWSKLSLSEKCVQRFGSSSCSETKSGTYLRERQYVEDRTADSIAADGIGNHMSSVRYSMVELRQMCEDIDNLCPRRLAELKAEVSEAPGCPSDDVANTFNDAGGCFEPPPLGASQLHYRKVFH